MNGDLVRRVYTSPRLFRNHLVINFGPQLLSVLAAALVWEVIGRLKISVIIPTVSGTLVALWKLLLSGQLLSNLVVSLGYFGTGFILAVVLGIGLGALMGRYQLVENIFELWINLGMSSPMLAFIPLLIILFGLGNTTRVAVCFMFAFWVIVVNTFIGTRFVDARLIEMARSYGADEKQLFWLVRIPGALPLIMAGIRMGIARAVKGMVNGEMLITVVGLGAMVMQYGATFNGDYLFAVTLVIVAVALLLTNMIKMIHRRLAHWDQ